MIEIIKPDFEFADERGKLIQLVHKGFTQFNIIFSKSGVVRGNHYHKENQEAFYVISGEFELTVQKDKLFIIHTFSQGDMFLIPPLVIHSFRFLADTLLASMYDIGVEFLNGEKDICLPDKS